jgi:hypothetical protein
MSRQHNDIAQALADRANQVPEAAAERVRQRVRQQLDREARRSRRMPIVGIAAAVVVGIGVGAGFLLPAVTGGSVAGPAGTAQRDTPAGTGPTIQLDSLQLSLPAGYRLSGNECLPATTAPVVPIRSSSTSALAPTGGCLTAELVPDNAIPPSTPTVSVSGHPGWLTTGTNGNTTNLLVEFPTAGGKHVLALIAEDIPADVLVTIARNALPPSPATTSPCAGPCG